MPLFFCISGYWIGRSPRPGSLIGVARRRVAPLLSRFLLFSVAGLVFQLVLGSVGSVRSSASGLAKEWLLSTLYASGTVGQPLRLDPVVLWFFPALSVGILVHYFVRKVPARTAWLAAAGSMVIGSYAAKYSLPWSIDAGLQALFFIHAGCVFGELTHRPGRSGRADITGALALLGVGAALALLIPRSGTALAEILALPLETAGGLVTILGLVLVAVHLPGHPWIRKISEATILIFPAHPFLFWIYSTGCRVSGLELGPVASRLVCGTFAIGMLTVAHAFFRSQTTPTLARAWVPRWSSSK